MPRLRQDPTLWNGVLCRWSITLLPELRQVKNRSKEMKTEIDKGLGKHLKDLRHMRDMTIKDLAEKSGYSTSHTSRIEKGERRADADYLLTVAPHLGIPQLALLNQAGYKLDGDNV